MKILTISVAAYNVQNTLDKTLNSMYDPQILNDLEVLIIDDGSTDKTAKIARKYVKLAPQTYKYIKKRNGGHGSTINKGISIATGKYFKVVDGDDWLNTKVLVRFIESLKNIDSDLILTNYIDVYPDHSKKMSLIKNMKSGKRYTWKDKIYVKRVVLHNLTVKTNLLRKNKVYITENCFYVDVEFVGWAAYVSKSITYLDLYLYMYRLGEKDQSVSKKNMLKNVNMQAKVSYQLVKMYDKFSRSKLPVKKEETLFRTFKRSVGSTMRTYLLMNTSLAKVEIKSFDKNIYKISVNSYYRLNSDKFIRIIRSFNYALIPVIKFLYRIWVKQKYDY